MNAIKVQQLFLKKNLKQLKKHYTSKLTTDFYKQIFVLCKCVMFLSNASKKSAI